MDELDGNLRALALVRASVEEDTDAIGALMEAPPTSGFIIALAAIAAAQLERHHGREGALAMIDGWRGLTLDLATDQPRPRDLRARGDAS